MNDTGIRKKRSALSQLGFGHATERSPTWLQDVNNSIVSSQSVHPGSKGAGKMEHNFQQFAYGTASGKVEHRNFGNVRSLVPGNSRAGADGSKSAPPSAVHVDSGSDSDVPGSSKKLGAAKRRAEQGRVSVGSQKVRQPSFPGRGRSPVKARAGQKRKRGKDDDEDDDDEDAEDDDEDEDDEADFDDEDDDDMEVAGKGKWQSTRAGTRSSGRVSSRNSRSRAEESASRPKRAAAVKATSAFVKGKKKDGSDEEDDEDDEDEEEDDDSEEERRPKKRLRKAGKASKGAGSGAKGGKPRDTRGASKKRQEAEDMLNEDMLKDSEDEGEDDYDAYSGEEDEDEGGGYGGRKRTIATRAKVQSGVINIDGDEEEASGLNGEGDMVDMSGPEKRTRNDDSAPASHELAAAEALAKDSACLRHLAPKDKLRFAVLWKYANSTRDKLNGLVAASHPAGAGAAAGNDDDSMASSGAAAASGAVDTGIVTPTKLRQVLGWGVQIASAITKSGNAGTGKQAAASTSVSAGAGASSAPASSSSSTSTTSGEALLNLTPYQLVGLNWMLLLHRTGVNGVLADEMGLGKSVQTIGLLAWLAAGGEAEDGAAAGAGAGASGAGAGARAGRGAAAGAGAQAGPFLIVTPASTVGNWVRELRKWAPGLRIGTYRGGADRTGQQRALITGIGLDEQLRAATETAAPEVSPRGSDASGGGGTQGDAIEVDSGDDEEEESEDGSSQDDEKEDKESEEEEEEEVDSEDEKTMKPQADAQRSFDVLITTYTMFDKQGALGMKDRAFLRKYAWSYLVCDEGHNLKNAAGQRFGALTALSTQHRLLLTGTPIQNTLPELFALLRFLQPTLFTKKVEALFTAQTGGGGSGGKRQESVLADLKRVVAPFILRRSKADVLSDLPEKTDSTPIVPLPPVHAAVYNAVVAEARSVLGLKAAAGAGKGAGKGSSRMALQDTSNDEESARMLADGESGAGAGEGFVRPGRTAAKNAVVAIAAAHLIERRPMRTLGTSGASSAPPALGHSGGDAADGKESKGKQGKATAGISAFFASSSAGAGAGASSVTGSTKVHPVDLDLSNVDEADVRAALDGFGSPVRPSSSSTSTTTGQPVTVVEVDDIEDSEEERTGKGAGKAEGTPSKRQTAAVPSSSSAPQVGSSAGISAVIDLVSSPPSHKGKGKGGASPGRGKMTSPTRSAGPSPPAPVMALAGAMASPVRTSAPAPAPAPPPIAPLPMAAVAALMREGDADGAGGASSSRSTGKSAKKLATGVFGGLRRASQHPLLLRVWYSHEPTLRRLAEALATAGAFGRDAAAKPDGPRIYEHVTGLSDYAIWELARETGRVEYEAASLEETVGTGGQGGEQNAGRAAGAGAGAGAETAQAAAPQRAVRPISAPSGLTGRKLLAYCCQALPPWALSSSAKLTWLANFLPDAIQQGHRVLLFSQLMDVLSLVGHVLSGWGVKWVRLDGSTPVQQRQQLIDQFNQDASIGVFLVSTRAGGLGLNLTAADTVIIHDSDWNPHADAQAVDRAHRLGQTRPVQVYRLVAAGTLDEKIAKVAASKLDLDRALRGGHTPAKKGKRKVDLDIEKLLHEVLQ